MRPVLELEAAQLGEGDELPNGGLSFPRRGRLALRRLACPIVRAVELGPTEIRLDDRRREPPRVGAAPRKEGKTVGDLSSNEIGSSSSLLRCAESPFVAVSRVDGSELIEKESRVDARVAEVGLPAERSTTEVEPE